MSNLLQIFQKNRFNVSKPWYLLAFFNRSFSTCQPICVHQSFALCQTNVNNNIRLWMMNRILWSIITKIPFDNNNTNQYQCQNISIIIISENYFPCAHIKTTFFHLHILFFSHLLFLIISKVFFCWQPFISHVQYRNNKDMVQPDEK